jgi:feruloyl-CoA hydratase/lyase
VAPAPAAGRAPDRDDSAHEWRHPMLNYFPRPTIAAINGYCFGGAFTIVASCDIAIAATEATFGLSEINFGNIPGGLVTKVVQDLMVPHQALYYILTGKRFDGQKAADIAFVTLAVPRAELDRELAETAAILKTKDPHALRACKETFKAITLSVRAEDAWYWLSAKLNELTLHQQGGWIELGIGRFLSKECKRGLESAPSVSQG